MQIINQVLQKIEIGLGAISIGLIFILNLLNIISRYFFNRPWPWSEEVITFSFIWLGYLTAAYTLSKDEHVRFTYFLDNFSLKLNRAIRIIFNILIIASLVILLPGALRNIKFMVLSPALEINMTIIYIIVPITYTIMIFHTMVNIINSLTIEETKIKDREEEKRQDGNGV